MRQTLTISLPEDLKKELDELSEREGVSRSDVIRESLRDYLFVRRFRALRAKMVAKAGARGIYTDEDVFDQVS
jgi:metal-responsive CopG/Arc/MetJ family transcriptional regulator